MAVWIAAVETLFLIVGRGPQKVYADFTFCLQNKLQYVQRVVVDVDRLLLCTVGEDD